MRYIALAAALVALAGVPAIAAPEGWSRPGGYYDQVKAGSLSNPVEPCPIPYAERVSPEVCARPAPTN